MSLPKEKIRGLVIAAIVVLIAGIVLVSSVTIVDAGNAGVILRLGAVQEVTLSEGFHFKIPFVTNIVKMNVRTQISEASCSAASKDLQTIKLTVAINFHVNRDAAAMLYQKVGMAYDTTIIQPALQESVKSVTAKFSAEELITRRQEVSDQIKDELAQKISPYGLSIEIFNITNLDFSDEFNQAIEAKQTAQQNALKAEQDLERVKMEAQQTIEQAKAEAEALRIKREQINDLMIKLEWVNKWDGKLPTVMGADGNIMDLSALLGE